MNFDIFTLAEGYDVGQNGAPTIFRCISNWRANAFPTKVSAILVLRLGVERCDDGNQFIDIKISDNDGALLVELDVNVSVKIDKGLNYGSIPASMLLSFDVKRPTVLHIEAKHRGSDLKSAIKFPVRQV